VHITTEAVMRLYRNRYATVPEGTGTGFLWDQNGTVVTNYHVVQTVVERGSQLKVGIGDDYYSAEVIGAAKEYDIAVLRVKGPPHNLRPIPIGSSNDLQVGQFVLAIGNPYGFDHSLSTGIISALSRTIRTENATLSGLIQTDAAINPGNSGGPCRSTASCRAAAPRPPASPRSSSTQMATCAPGATSSSPSMGCRSRVWRGCRTCCASTSAATWCR
jgi:S1-C subfamily serine protease